MNATSFRSLAALSLALAWAASATGASDAPADPRESNAWFAAGRVGRWKAGDRGRLRSMNDEVEEGEDKWVSGSGVRKYSCAR